MVVDGVYYKLEKSDVEPENFINNYFEISGNNFNLYIGFN